MKNFTVLILNLVFYSTAICQPVIDSIALPKNIKIPFSFGQALDPGASGENVTWDFSAHPLTNIGSFERVEPSSTPYYDSFPNSNYSFKITLTNSTSYNYYNLSSKTFDWIGVRWGLDNIDLKPDPFTFVKFPFKYQDTIVDSYKSKDNSVNEVDTRIYDGYGTLITPYATYNNAVRIKSTTSQNEVSYDWYVVAPNFFTFSIFQINVANNSTRVFDYGITTGVNDITADVNTIKVYPNPANKVLTIDHRYELAKLSIYDLSGRKINEHIITPTQNTIDISNLAAGLYTYQVFQQGKLLKNGKVVVN